MPQTNTLRPWKGSHWGVELIVNGKEFEKYPSETTWYYENDFVCLRVAGLLLLIILLKRMRRGLGQTMLKFQFPKLIGLTSLIDQRSLVILNY